MKQQLVCLVGLLVVLVASSAYGQPSPQLSETFHLVGTFHQAELRSSTGGNIVWVSDLKAGKSLTNKTFLADDPVYCDLLRYDLASEFSFSNANKICDTNRLKGPMKPFWGWVEQATFRGNTSVNGQKGNLWTFSATDAGPLLEVVVSANDPTQLLKYKSSYAVWDSYTIYSNSWSTKIPSGVFDIPKECKPVT